jgi:hypothetical protein
MACPICFDDMDMIEYNDEREGTATCFKLGCGHAFHTKCIIDVLSKTQHTCPSCNKHKGPAEQIERCGVIANLLKTVKKDERVKIARAEYAVATAEYVDVIAKLRSEARAWIQEKAKELNVLEHRKYWKSTISAVKRAARDVASEKGVKYTGAMEAEDRVNRRWGLRVSEVCLFGKHARIRDYRLTNPRVWCTL